MDGTLKGVFNLNLNLSEDIKDIDEICLNGVVYVKKKPNDGPTQIYQHTFRPYLGSSESITVTVECQEK